jgi:hypothetical protein
MVLVLQDLRLLQCITTHDVGSLLPTLPLRIVDWDVLVVASKVHHVTARVPPVNSAPPAASNTISAFQNLTTVFHLLQSCI